MTQIIDEWFYAQDSAQVGPHTLAEMRQLASAGKVTQQTMVWTSGMPQWAAAGSVAALFAPAVAPPPLPAMGPQPIGYAQAYPPSPQQGIGQDAGIRMLIPVGRSGWAIAAGYAGLFALVPFFAPIALVLGLVALRDLKKHPESHGKGRAIFGLVMGVIFSLFLTLGIFAVMFGK